MKFINQRINAIRYLHRKLQTLLHSFQEDCQTSYEEAARLLFQFGLENLQIHIRWLEYYNSHAPLLKWNSNCNYIELHYPGGGRVMKTSIAEYTKLTIYLQQESLELPRKKAFYLLEMLYCARNLHQLTQGGNWAMPGPLDPLVHNLLFLDDTIVKFHYLVYQLLPLYRDHIRLQCD